MSKDLFSIRSSLQQLRVNSFYYHLKAYREILWKGSTPVIVNFLVVELLEISLYILITTEKQF